MSAFSRELLKWTRTLHIYLSLLGFTLFLFFALTGIQLTHESFGLDTAQPSATAVMVPPEAAKSGQREQVLEALPRHLAVERFEVREQEIEVTMMRPGERAQVRIERASGKGEIHHERRGWIGAMADLHKGAATGSLWHWLMDLTCVWIILSSITGIAMVFSLPKRKALGLLSVAAGTVLALAAYLVIPAG